MDQQTAWLLKSLLGPQGDRLTREKAGDSRRSDRALYQTRLDDVDAVDSSRPSLARLLLKQAQGQYLSDLSRQLEEEGRTGHRAMTPMIASLLQLDR